MEGASTTVREGYYFAELSKAKKEELLAAFAALAMFLGKPYLPNRNNDFHQEYERIKGFCMAEVQSHGIAVRYEGARMLNLYYGSDTQDFSGKEWGKIVIRVDEPLGDAPDAIADALIVAYRKFPAVAKAPKYLGQVLASQWQMTPV